MPFQRLPATFDELCQQAEAIRPALVALADRMRWCWIAEYDGEDYWLGTQIEGQSTWRKVGILQHGAGRTALEWVARLNHRDGLSDIDVTAIVRAAGFPSARACLSADEANVCVMLRGVFCEWDVAPSTMEMARQFGELPELVTAFPKPIQLRHIFTLEVDVANDLVSCLFLLNSEKRLPVPNAAIRDVDVIQDEGTGDTTFFIPGELEFDAHDDAIFTLVIDLQTAADLFAVTQEKFLY